MWLLWVFQPNRVRASWKIAATFRRAGAFCRFPNAYREDVRHSGLEWKFRQGWVSPELTTVVGNSIKATLGVDGTWRFLPDRAALDSRVLQRTSPERPASSTAVLSLPPPVTASGFGYNRKQVGSKPDACIWTGIKGDLLSPARGLTPQMDTQFEAGDKTFAEVQSLEKPLSTYAFCYTFTGMSSSWKYKRIGPFGPSGMTGLMPMDLARHKSKQILVLYDWRPQVGEIRPGDAARLTPAPDNIAAPAISAATHLRR